MGESLLLWFMVTSHAFVAETYGCGLQGDVRVHRVLPHFARLRQLPPIQQPQHQLPAPARAVDRQVQLTQGHGSRGDCGGGE